MLSSGKLGKAIGAGLIAWMVVIHTFIWPDYLSYFNELIGGPGKGYLFLRDSNIDWGQDLPGLRKYMDENNIDNIRLLYFGTADPLYYGIEYADLDVSEHISPINGRIYAVSVHYLESVEWGGKIPPSTNVGNSIFIYDLRGEHNE
jgi:hypothetical protein